MLKVLNKEMPIHVHAHRSMTICTAIRIAQEYDVDLVWSTAPTGSPSRTIWPRISIPVIVGPGMTPAQA